MRAGSVKVVLGVTSSIAIYKALELLRRLKDRDFSVKVILTPFAKQLISPILFSSLGAEAVYWEMFPIVYEASHVPIADWADVLLVAPLTANTLSKFAHGIADNLLTTIFLSFGKKPIILAPAMHTQMWNSPVIQRNVNTLKESFNIDFVGPIEGKLACGQEGTGRMADCEVIVERLEAFLTLS